MRLTIQADYLVKKYGADEAFFMLKELGYQAVSYELYEVYENSSFADWTEEELRAYFEPIGNAAKRNNLEVAFVSMSRGIYNDYIPQTFENRKAWCRQTVKAAAYMGSKMAVIRPTFFYQKQEDAKKLSELYTREVLETMTEVAKERQVQVGLFNNHKSTEYGSRGAELSSLANTYQVKILIDPTFAYQARVAMRDILNDVKEHLSAIMVADIERVTDGPMGIAYPAMMGQIDFDEIKELLQECSEGMYLTTMSTELLKRYGEACQSKSFVDALLKYLFKVSCVLSGRESGFGENRNTTRV